LDISHLWDSILVTPLAAALSYLAAATGSSGLAIIFFTIIVKLVLFPLTWQQIKSQKAMMILQPKLKAAQKRYANDRQKLNEEMMRVYKENNVNPLAGCLPLFIQMPIWFALYQALINLGNREHYMFDPAFEQGFLWITNLAQPDHFSLPFIDQPIPNPVLPVTTALTQLVIQRMMTAPTMDPQQQQMNRMMQFMPVMFLVFSLNFPAGLVLYWVTSNLVSMVQQYFLTGWGGLFPGGYKPKTPFAGSWEPSGSPNTNGSDPANGDADEPPTGSTGPRAQAARPGNGQVARRARKEKRRGAKR
jgi:YidC/Oxa1 family membrane protein insertase